jgi:hypothetical protein
MGQKIYPKAACDSAKLMRLSEIFVELLSVFIEASLNIVFIFLYNKAA